jgi:signal transduction histidine kinase
VSEPPQDRRFQDFAEIASDWFWETDASHRFTFISGNRFNSIPETLSEILGRSRIEIVELYGHPVPEHLLTLERIMDRREVFHGFVYERPTNKPYDRGRIQFCELSGRPVFDASGTFLGYRGTGRDVTAQREREIRVRAMAEAEARRSAEMRRLVSRVNHELRTPLTVIDSSAQRLGARLAEDADAQLRIDRIRASVSRAVDVIERMLSSARLEDGRVTTAKESLDLLSLVGEVTSLQKQINPAFDFTIEAENPGLAVEGDRHMLEMVVSNLLSNAVKYSGESRAIGIQLGHAEGGRWVELAVTDQGIGIPHEELPMLFRRFFRASTARGLPGSGLGLSLVREFVQMHGGSVSATSTPGAGSIFRVRLPARA